MKRMIPVFSILAGLALMAGTAQASITVNSVTVLPGASITVAINATINGSDHWRTSKWQIEGGSWSSCLDIPNPDPRSGTYTESFSITVPANQAVGTYDLNVQAYGSNGCSGSCASRNLMSANVPASAELGSGPGHSQGAHPPVPRQATYCHN